MRRLALETIDLSKDPYFMRNHLGQYECRLCLTLHNNEGNYLAHTQVRASFAKQPVHLVIAVMPLAGILSCRITRSNCAAMPGTLSACVCAGTLSA